MDARLIRLLNRLLRRSNVHLVAIEPTYTSLPDTSRHRNPALVALPSAKARTKCR